MVYLPGLASDLRETGVGCNTPVGTTKQLESNKIETLRLLLSIISSPIYSPGGYTSIRIFLANNEINFLVNHLRTLPISSPQVTRNSFSLCYDPFSTPQ